MEKIEKVIQNKFIELLNKGNIEEIDVNLLSKECNITRQAFYYHYKNIYDLIFSIYIDKKIKGDVNYLIDIYLNSIRFLYEDDEFNKIILSSSYSDVVNDYLYSYYLTSLTKVLNKYSDETDKKYRLARLLSFGLIEELLSLYLKKYKANEIVLSLTKLLSEKSLKYLIDNIK